MTAHDWYVENRAAYVARALAPSEERLFADHLGRCEECARAVAQLEHDLRWLPMGVTPAAPRPGLSHELADRILRRTPAWRRIGPLAAAAAVAAFAAGFGIREHHRSDTLLAELDARDHRLAALEDTLSVMRDAHRVVQRDIAMDGHHGGLVIFQDATSHRWNVVVHGLPPAPAGQVYQFWFVTESGMVRSVELRCDGSKPAFATVPMPKQPMTIMGAALTVEPVVNHSGPPEGRELVHVQF
jgi:hypothetical protein